MTQIMTAHAQTIAPDQQTAWTKIAMPAAQGLIAHAQQDYAATLASLSPVLKQLWKLGDSHAQRLMFSQIHQHAALHLQHRHHFSGTLSAVDGSQLFALARRVG